MIPPSHHDLLAAPQLAVLSTIDAAGFPQSTAVFFDFTDGVLRVSITADRSKYKNLVERPRLSFFVVDPKNPYRTLEVRGTATLQDDADFSFRNRVSAQYHFDSAKIDGPATRRVIVTIHPTKVHARG